MFRCHYQFPRDTKATDAHCELYWAMPDHILLRFMT